MYKVIFREIDTTETKEEIMSGKMLGCFEADWAFEVLKVEPIEVPKKKKFFFF